MSMPHSQTSSQEDESTIDLEKPIETSSKEEERKPALT